MPLMESPDAASPGSQMLSYSQRPSRRVRRILGSVFIILAVGFTFVGWKWRDGLRNHLTTMYWERRCLRYDPSGETIIYDRGSTIQNGFPSPLKGQGMFPAATGTVPNCWTQFDLTAGPFLTSPPSTLNRVPDAIAFLHERRSPSGKVFLVCVAVYSEWTIGPRVAIGVDVMAAIAIDPAGLAGVPTVQQRQTINSLRHFGGDPRLQSKQVFAGEPDAADPSHFTVKYKVGGVTDVMDGIIDDRGNVKLTPRNPPRFQKNQPPPQTF